MILPTPLIVRRRIINKLLEKNAVTGENAITLEEAGIENPDNFQAVILRLIEQGVLHQLDGRYYLDTTKQ
ncbi:MAG: hypothetical protein K2M44_03300 [Clostridia bacterium]|nr:hypothetical protein [Clostridia bacterium]